MYLLLATCDLPPVTRYLLLACLLLVDSQGPACSIMIRRYVSLGTSKRWTAQPCARRSDTACWCVHSELRIPLKKRPVKLNTAVDTQPPPNHNLILLYGTSLKDSLWRSRIQLHRKQTMGALLDPHRSDEAASMNAQARHLSYKCRFSPRYQSKNDVSLMKDNDLTRSLRARRASQTCATTA